MTVVEFYEVGLNIEYSKFSNSVENYIYCFLGVVVIEADLFILLRMDELLPLLIVELALLIPPID